jgi:hypothetical protein
MRTSTSVTSADQAGRRRPHGADGRAQHERRLAASPTRSPCLQRGAVLAEGLTTQVSRNPAVMEAYMGTVDGELQGAH